MKKSVLCLMMLVGCQKGSTEAPPTLYEGKPESFWLDQSKSGDEAPKTEAMRALANFSDPPARDVLKSALSEPRASVRFYAAEALWKDDKNAAEVIPALQSVISDPLGWSLRDRMIPLFKDMGPAAKPLIPNINEAIANAPNSKVAKWQEVLNVIPN